MVCKIFTKSETSVSIQIGQHFDVREEVCILSCTCIEVLCIVCCPPIAHVSVLIIVSSLIIKAVSHLVTNHYSDRTIVESVVCFGVKERSLKDTCRETYFVCGWVIVCIYCLRSHQPLVFINRFASLFLYGFVVPVEHTLHYIIVI